MPVCIYCDSGCRTVVRPSVAFVHRAETVGHSFRMDTFNGFFIFFYVELLVYKNDGDLLKCRLRNNNRLCISIHLLANI